jgi:hypothetical protein
MSENTRFVLALGQAVIKSWGELPQEIQHTLFESAVVAGHHSEKNEMFREQLATYLHGKHPRTHDSSDHSTRTQDSSSRGSRP